VSYLWKCFGRLGLIEGLACVPHRQGSTGGGSLGETVVESRTQVYASPIRTPIDAEVQSREDLPQNPTICWPEISFSVVNFEETFESLIVSEVDSYFCVVLSIRSSKFLSCDQTAESSSSNSLLLPKDVVFSGLVTYSQVKVLLVLQCTCHAYSRGFICAHSGCGSDIGAYSAGFL